MVDIEVYSNTKGKLRQPAAYWLPSGPLLIGTAAHTNIAAETSRDVVVDAITATKDPGRPGPSLWMQTETQWTPSRI